MPAAPVSTPRLPARPTAGEVWWVAVEGASGPSGGWVVLADEGANGAAQIQAAFARAGVGLLAAVDAASLHGLFGLAPADRPETSVVVLRTPGDQVSAQVRPGGPGEALVATRLENPEATVVLVESQDAAVALYHQLWTIAQTGDLAGVRLDLRRPPRGAGTWGLARWRAR